MKTIIVSLKEYMILRELAIKYSYTFDAFYDKDNKEMEVTIQEEFLDAFGFND